MTLPIRPTVVADHNAAYNEARTLMAELGIQSLPVNPFEIAEQLNIELISYTEAFELFPQSIDKLRTKKIDAIVVKPDYALEEYLILYDDFRPFDRVRFTIAHEIGHVRLNHMCRTNNQLNRFSYTKISDPIEQEAESFAGELLRPPLLLSLVKAEEPYSIQSICDVSYSAAAVGSRKVKNIKKNPRSFHRSFIHFYHDQFYDFIHQKYCRTCHYYFINQHAVFCPICGEKTLMWGNTKDITYEFWGEVVKMQYDKFKLDRDSKAVICPRCENEEIHPQYNTCKICGEFLVNMCSGKYKDDGDGNEYQHSPSCNVLADGNQRFCYMCGGITTFYRSDLLPHWREEYNRKKGIPEEIPF